MRSSPAARLAAWVCLGMACVLAPIDGFGELVWKTTFLQKSIELTSTEVVLEFPFQNKGTTPVTIVSATALCSCTTVELKKKTYAPGESGVLTATFSVGDRAGIVDRAILVETDKPSDKVERLAFRIVIPVMATLAPDHLVWKLGGAPSTQAMAMTVKQAAPVGLLEAEASDPNFRVEIKTVQKGFKYRILVTPVRTSAPIRTVVTIRTDYPPVRPRTMLGEVEVASPSAGGE